MNNSQSKVWDTLIEIQQLLEENFDDYFKKYPLIYRMVPNLNAPKEEIAYHIAKINEKRAHKLLFTILEQNIRRWWD